MIHKKQEVGQDLAWLITRHTQKKHLAAVWAAHAGLAPGMRVLDIGAGTGALTLVYARMVAPGGLVLAVDPNEAALAYLAEAAARESLVVETSSQLGEALIPAPAPDRVLMTDTLHHASDPRLLLRSARAVMHEQSVLLIAEYDPEGGGVMGAKLARRIAPGTVSQWLMETGFVPEVARSAPDEHYVILARAAWSRPTQLP